MHNPSHINNNQLAALREEYSLKQFDEKQVDSNPFNQFATWFNEAVNAQVPEPNAMTLATVNQNNMPSARIVLLKNFSDNGFSFFTNYDSHKGQALDKNPHVALVFCWLELQRQIRVEGVVTKLSAKENDDYFYSRPRGSQIGAIASAQSTILPNRSVLEQKIEEIAQQETIKRPLNWGGYLVKPQLIEFWQGRSSRLHDRFVFTLHENTWQRNRLAP